MQVSVQWNFAILHPDLADRSKLRFDYVQFNEVVYLDAVY